MTKYLQYLTYLWRHKKFVYQEGRNLGLGRWQLLIHDLSKFRPSEFLPYARFFYGSYPSIYAFHGDVRNMYLSAGCYKEKVEEDFDHAWLLHQHRNPHHYQHWVLREDSGETKLLPMPHQYLLEMIADWRGAGRALGNSDTLGWYRKNRENISLNPETRADVERKLGYTA